jgi:hypothetical protein
MSNIFGCSVRMVANRRRVWKVMTSFMQNCKLGGKRGYMWDMWPVVSCRLSKHPHSILWSTRRLRT